MTDAVNRRAGLSASLLPFLPLSSSSDRVKGEEKEKKEKSIHFAWALLRKKTGKTTHVKTCFLRNYANSGIS